MSISTYALSSGKVQGDRLWAVSFVSPLVGEMSDEIIELKKKCFFLTKTLRHEANSRGTIPSNKS